MRSFSPRLILSAMVLAMVLAAACSDDPVPGQCATNAECDPGSICESATCIRLCTTQRDCDAGEVCVSSRCAPPTSGPLPSIQSVTGNDPAVTDRIIDGLVVIGANLGSAVFELQEGQSASALTVRSQSPDTAELVLPVDVTSGDKVLVATNGAGSVDQMITLTLPDLNGETLMSRINAEASSPLSTSLLQVGTASGTVSSGDHNHDSAYYAAGSLDMTLADLSAALAQGVNMARNGRFESGSDGWTVTASGSGSFTVASVGAAGVAGTEALTNDNLTRVTSFSEDLISLEQGGAYALTGYFRNTDPMMGMFGGVDFGIRLYEVDGTTEIPGAVDWWQYAATAQNPPASWSRYTLVFGAGTPNPLPAAAFYARVAVRLNDDGSGSPGNRIFQAQGLGLRMLPLGMVLPGGEHSLSLGDNVFVNGQGSTGRISNNAYVQGSWQISDATAFASTIELRDNARIELYATQTMGMLDWIKLFGIDGQTSSAYFPRQLVGFGTESPAAPITIAGTGKEGTPDGRMHITNDTILFGGPNTAGFEGNSAQISAGKHAANSLNLVGMSDSGGSSGSRRIDFWAEGGATLRGVLTCTGGCVASSRARKFDIEDLEHAEALAALEALRPTKYRYKEWPEDPRVGFIAEEVPELVAAPERKGLDTIDIAAVLTKVVQQQQAIIQEQQRRLDALEARVSKK